MEEPSEPSAESRSWWLGLLPVLIAPLAHTFFLNGLVKGNTLHIESDTLLHTPKTHSLHHTSAVWRVTDLIINPF